jgi:hypothetical protein
MTNTKLEYIDLNLANAAIGIAKMKDFYLLITSFNEVYLSQYGE